MIRLLRTIGLVLGMGVVASVALLPFKLVEYRYGWGASAGLALAAVIILAWFQVGPTCRHDWDDTGSTLIDLGRSKMFFERCKKCGKTRRTFV